MGGDEKPVRGYFYPRSPCGERRRGAANCYLDNIISIHALLAESDVLELIPLTDPSPFLSTLSLRRATRFRSWLIPSDRNFYPRSPCGERHTGNNIGRGNTIFLSTLSLRRATLDGRFKL